MRSFLLMVLFVVSQMHVFVNCAALQKEEPFHFRAWNEKRDADSPSQSSSHSPSHSSSDDWILFQQRKLDNDTDLFQEMGWAQYKRGFGHPNGKAYWMGLERMHQMTSTGKWQLILVVHVQGHDKTYSFVVYDDFKIKSELKGYQLKIGSLIDRISFFASLDSKNLLVYNNRAPFSTKDRDNDFYSEDCANSSWNGGWWYKSCSCICFNCARRLIIGGAISGNLVVTETQMAMMKVTQ